MLPTLSRLSVSYGPGSRLRHWCSSQYLRISPLHWEFHCPLPHSRPTVSDAGPWLSQGISHRTDTSAYTPFTPSNSGQRSPPTSYRGCWHVVSRGLFAEYRHLFLPLQKEFTIRKPSSSTHRCWIRLAPIVQNSPLLPPVGVGPVSQCPCGRSPFKAGYPSSPW